MKIALISDIHGNLAALEAVTADIRQCSVDRVINLGDSLSGPLLPMETARFLMNSGWMSLAGNHERQLLTLCPGRGGLSDEYAFSTLSSQELDWLKSLKPTFLLDDELFFCHGTPEKDDRYLLEEIENGGVRLADGSVIEERLAGEKVPIIGCGHSHLPRSVLLKNGQMIINSGSVGLPAYHDDEPIPHRVETGSPDARYVILEKRNGEWTAEHRIVSYDTRSMAELAAKRNRPDWKIALLTGRMGERKQNETAWICPSESELFHRDVRLRFAGVIPGESSNGWVPAYHFQIIDADGTNVGHINFRPGESEHVRRVAGHIGYEIKPPYRGNGYSRQACMALTPYIRLFCNEVVITCDPDNLASRRIMEQLGAEFMDEAPVPVSDPNYTRGSRIKRRYRWRV